MTYLQVTGSSGTGGEYKCSAYYATQGGLEAGTVNSTVASVTITSELKSPPLFHYYRGRGSERGAWKIWEDMGRGKDKFIPAVL